MIDSKKLLASFGVHDTGEARCEYQLPTIGDQFQATAAELHAKIMANRERYLEAWIAETGLLPSECEVVERQSADGFDISTTTIVQKRGGIYADLREKLAEARADAARAWARVKLLETRVDTVRDVLDGRVSQ